MLEIRNLSLELGEFKLKEIQISVEKGEYYILLGESGAGKSVLLESIAGLVKPAKGSIILNGNDITRLNIQRRKIGLVFQDFALFPHLSVYENIAYPLKIRRRVKSEIKKKVDELASLMDIACLFDRNTETLSGGEKQRVALARTLTLNPDVLLLDEPLSSIDISLKGELRSLLRKINQSGQTIMHVTHDYEEAISLAHRIGIIHEGEIIQTGTPNEVFRNPKNKFVAHFGGIKNFYEARLEANPDHETTKACITPQISFKILTQHKAKTGFVLINQKNIILSPNPEAVSTLNHFKGIIQEIVPAKLGYEIVINCGILFYVSVTSEVLNQNQFFEGKETYVAFNPSSVRFIPG